MCEFQASDIVECIDDTPVLEQSRTMPDKGRLYRVESVKIAGDGHSVRLLELTPDCHAGGACACGNCGWDSRRFRRIARDDGKIALFQAMLDTPERQDAPIADPVG